LASDSKDDQKMINEVEKIDTALPKINIKHLDLNSQGIVRFPDILCHIGGLTYLNLGENKKIISISKCIKNHRYALNTLILRNCALGSIPDSIPDEIGELKALTILNLSGNGITKLPSAIGDLSSLSQLYLQGNKLKTLPPSIGNLSNLIILDISDNQINSLPFEISKLTKLEQLYLSNNQIEQAPAFLPYLVNLSKLLIFGNPLDDGERKIISKIFEDTETDIIMIQEKNQNKP
jgi:Leucine-rich repeat (LRR) protein